MGMHVRRSKARKNKLCQRLAPETIARLQGNPSKASMKKRTLPALLRACAFIRLFHERSTRSSVASVPVIESSDTDESGQDPLSDMSLEGSPSSQGATALAQAATA
jgi:hypothetical protein